MITTSKGGHYLFMTEKESDTAAWMDVIKECSRECKDKNIFFSLSLSLFCPIYFRIYFSI